MPEPLTLPETVRISDYGGFLHGDQGGGPPDLHSLAPDLDWDRGDQHTRMLYCRWWWSFLQGAATLDASVWCE